MKVWRHPITGETRVYLNNLPSQRSAKVWVQQQPADSFGDELNIQISSFNHTRGEAGNLLNEAERYINEKAGAKVRKWEDLLEIAK